METDSAVVIVGGGPAGCAAALTLRRYLPELSVVLISMPAPVALAVGETLSPGVLPLLGYLGIQEDFLAAGHLPAPGTASAWGSAQVFERDYLFTGRGNGWHLDRSAFDSWLLAHAEGAGTRCLRARARARGVSRIEGRWRIELEEGGAITADAIVDASGRTAWLARHEGSPPHRDDALVAEARWYEETAGSSAGTLVETVPDGWWYSAALPDNRGVAMFMTDTDLRNTSSREDRLAAAPATRVRLAAWREGGETVIRPANSQRSAIVVGDGWVAAGDAAVAFDPISSLGIGFSLRSGMEAARVAAAVVEYDDGPAAAYSESTTRIYDEYRARLRAIYQREGRWPDSPFWARRL